MSKTAKTPDHRKSEIALAQEALRQAGPPANVPAIKKTSNAEYRSRYQVLDDLAPTNVVGHVVRFNGKGGGYFRQDNEEQVDEGTRFVAHCDQALVGFKRFHGEGTPPDVAMSLLFDESEPPPHRGALGDTDESDWPIGLNGTPEDPWSAWIHLPIEDVSTHEMATLTVTSKTGRRAVAGLLQHYRRTKKIDPADMPIIRLTTGSYQDTKYGKVLKPVLPIVGHTGGAAKPAVSVREEFNDSIDDILPNI